MKRASFALIFAIALVLAALPACAGTMNIDDVGMSITIPDTWKFGAFSRIGGSFDRKDDPQNYFGLLVVGVVEPGENVRSIAEKQIADYKAGSEQCGQIYEDRYIADLWTAFYYKYYYSPVDRKPRSNANYIVIRGNYKFWLLLSGPSGELKTRPGLLDTFDYIKNNIRFW